MDRADGAGGRRPSARGEGLHRRSRGADDVGCPVVAEMAEPGRRRRRGGRHRPRVRRADRGQDRADRAVLVGQRGEPVGGDAGQPAGTRAGCPAGRPAGRRWRSRRGEADVALGTDTGGSVRIPAACCGVVGLKTAWGRVPVKGVYPLAPSLDTVGPLGRDVAAVELGMRLIEPGFTARPEAELTAARLGVHRRRGRRGPGDRRGRGPRARGGRRDRDARRVL